MRVVMRGSGDVGCSCRKEELVGSVGFYFKP